MWRPEQYEQFKLQRAQPFYDLLSLITPRQGMKVLDLGCGAGQLTLQLHERLAAAETVGIDNSETMLAQARSIATAGLRFETGDIATFEPGASPDLIFSNAAVHWVPEHKDLLARLSGFLPAEGQLAIQMPANDDHPSHRIAAELAIEMGAEPRRNHLLALEDYASILHELDFRQQHVRMQVYGHELDSSEAVVDWVRGALLTDYESRLGSRFPGFLEEYGRRVVEALGASSPFFYTYKRILIWASR